MRASSWFLLSSLFLISFSSCMSAKHIRAQEMQTDLALRQMHSEIEEQKYKFNRLEVELQIVEGKADSQSEVSKEILKELAKLSQKESKLLESTLSELKLKIEELEQKDQMLYQKLQQLSLLAESHALSLKLHKEQFNETELVLLQQKQVLRDLEAHLQSLFISTDYEEAGHLYYVVQKGDSLESIAQTHQVSLEKLVQLNELSSQQVAIGQKLRLN